MLQSLVHIPYLLGFSRRLDWLVSNDCTVGITIWGILYKSLAENVNHRLSLIMYLVMGWVGVLFLPRIIFDTSLAFMLFILFGGIAYTIGAWFYAQKDRPYFHMIWHFFIVIASVFHFIAIIYFM